VLKIDSVQFSKQPVAVSEAFLISIEVSEVKATWGDVKAKTWGEIKSAGNWEKVKDKYF
jgi:hypothetical protein